LNPLIERPENEAQVFSEPWEAQVFAMAVSLHEVGLFTWLEWTRTLAEEMRADPSAGPCGEATYQAWLSALEVMLIRKAVTDRDGLAALRKS
jgi:nitrile hydratase accessory protein